MLFALLALLVHAPQGPGRDGVLASCAQLFGPRVESSALFEINRFYVLRVQFGTNGRLDEAAVEPRFYYRDTHPDWQEPGDFEWLSVAQHDDMLAKLKMLRPFGRLIQAHRGPVFVTNLTGPLTDDYENATVIRGQIVDIRRGDGAPVLFRYIKVRYKNAR